MTYIKHNGQWKRTTGVTIKQHGGELFLTPQVPDLPTGITMTEERLDTGSHIVITKRMPASPSTTFYVKNENKSNSGQQDRLKFYLSLKGAKSILMSGVTTVSGANGGNITVDAHKNGSLVKTLYSNYHPGQQSTFTQQMHLTADVSDSDTIVISMSSFAPGVTEITLNGIAFGY